MPKARLGRRLFKRYFSQRVDRVPLQLALHARLAVRGDVLHGQRQANRHPCSAPPATGRLGLAELNVHRVSQMRGPPANLDAEDLALRCEADVQTGGYIPRPLWYNDTAVAQASRGLKVMPKRGIDADNRIFFDELPSMGVSRLRATGVIRLEDRRVVIPFGGRMKLIGVAHTVFKNGGSWSFFRCPKCGGRAKKLWLVDDAPRCRLCLEKLGVRYRSAYAFGQSERLRERDRRVDRLQAMLEGGPLRVKPVPANWGNRRLDRRIRLTWSLQRARIFTRLDQIAHQHEQSSKPDEPLPFLRAYKPRAAAIEAIPNLKSIWRARTTEQLQQALDDAQDAILQALESKDRRTRLKAAKLMLRTREARQRGWS
jgi:hypothetical protein